MTDPLRIAHLGTAASWRGGEQQQLWLATGLQEMGHQCLMICRRGSQMAGKARANNIEVREIRGRGSFSPSSIWGTAAGLRSFRPDVLHMHDAHAASIGSLASKLAPRCKLLASRRVDFKVNSSWKYTWAVDRIISISQAIADILVECGISRQKISIVNSGIDLTRMADLPPKKAARSALDIPEDALAIGMVAALTDHKGHRYLLEAWPRVRSSHPEAILLLAGSGELEAQLREQAQALEISDSVRFLGYCSNVPGLLAALDLFVISSHKEGLCTSLMDAMAAQLPIVATEAGGIPEVVEDMKTGIIVPPRNPQVLAEAIISLAADRELATSLSTLARETAQQKFDYQQMVTGTLDIYREVLNAGGAS
jgi:L-malate glycosyltransferase